MRYLIQAVAMIGELMLLVGALWLAAHPTIGNVMVLAIGLLVWQYDAGGIMFSWRPSVIKQFMANAKKLGL